MRVVQALYWLRDMLPRDKDRIFKRLITILRDPQHGKAIRDDLRDGLPTLPEWMQAIVRDLLQKTNDSAQIQNDDLSGHNKMPSLPTINHQATRPVPKIKEKR